MQLLSNTRKKCVSVAMLALLTLTPFSNAFALDGDPGRPRLTQAPQSDSDKLKELAELCAGIEQELEDTKIERDLYKKRSKNYEKEVAQLRLALKEADTQDVSADTALVKAETELAGMREIVKKLEERVAELKTELDRVRDERDALRGTPWGKIGLALLLGLGAGLAIGNSGN